MKIIGKKIGVVLLVLGILFFIGGSFAYIYQVEEQVEEDTWYSDPEYREVRPFKSLTLPCFMLGFIVIIIGVILYAVSSEDKREGPPQNYQQPQNRRQPPPPPPPKDKKG